MDVKELIEKIRRYEIREALLNRINPEVNREDVIDVEKFLIATVNELGRMMGVDRCDFMTLGFHFVNSGDGIFRVEYEYRRDENLPSVLKTAFPVENGHQIGMLGTVVINNTSQDELPKPFDKIVDATQTTSLLSIPVKFRDEVLGILGLHYCGKIHEWSHDEITILESLAQDISVGLQYTRLYVQMEKEVEITKTLLSIANEINSKLDFTEITSFVLEKAVELLKASYGCIGILDTSEKLLNFTTFYPEGIVAAKELNIDPIPIVESPLFQSAIFERQTVYTSDFNGEEPPDPYLEEKFKGRSAIIAPIVISDRSHGILNLIWNVKRDAFEPHEVELISGITNQMAVVLEKNRLSSEVLRLKGELTSTRSVMIVGASAEIEKSINMALHVADSDTTVLLKGETGTGKELIADLIQKNSSRSEGPYIKINCGAITETLIESELFGYEKGAFTDAKTQKIGKFEIVDGGTIFLDEVGELSLNAQVKLLRVLQNGELFRVGGTQAVKVNVRVIAATNIDLEEAMERGSFRKDLYYRLNVFPISLPPLRERRGDIPLLAHHFLEIHKKKAKKPIIGTSEEAMRLLKLYNWPGNIRELENAIERAVIACSGIVITVEDLPENIGRLGDKLEELNENETARTNYRADTDKGHVVVEVGSTMDEIEKRTIKETLRYTKGDKKHAAKILGISRKTIYRKLEKYGFL